MNQMVFCLQPDIIVNNRNRLAGDSPLRNRPSRRNRAARAWESCMTLNDSWGYQHADDNLERSRTVIRNLITCAATRQLPAQYRAAARRRHSAESVRILTAVGEWMKRNGETIYAADICQPHTSVYANFTRKAKRALHACLFSGRARTCPFPA